MGISEAASLLVMSRAIPGHSCCPLSQNTLPFLSPLKINRNGRRKRAPLYLRASSNSDTRQNFPRLCGTLPAYHRSQFVTTQCQRIEKIVEITNEDGNGTNGTWVKDAVSKASQVLGDVNGQKAIGFENGVIESSDDKSTPVGAANSASPKKRGNYVEDEAWRLLQESMVFYCGSPVGTIAAKDPSDSNVLNYDQVFIRDFIPSGIAFLLKGEYDIVRNFILHTLQLQVIFLQLPFCATILMQLKDMFVSLLIAIYTVSLSYLFGKSSVVTIGAIILRNHVILFLKNLVC